jgi:two-component system, cell cycle sensor histidine kinase and response regulator CckA
LLAFSRRQILRPTVLSLNEIIGRIEPMLRRLLGDDVTLAVQLDTALVNVRVDANQVEQVILNLVVNSRDAMPTGGRITIATANVTVDPEYAAGHPGAQAGPHALLTVSDTGEGMDDTTRQRIFEPFFTTKDFGKGTGLGLATVYGIVKQSGGYIAVHSAPGKGTAMRVFFPAAEGAVAAPQPPQPAALRGGTETILVVDDDAALRSVTERVLRRAGYTVVTARGGKEALDMIARLDGRLKLILTDVVMPDMNGPALASRVAELHPGIRVLFASGYPDDAVTRHGVLPEGVEFIGKPFTVAELAARVREVLDRPEPRPG